MEDKEKNKPDEKNDNESNFDLSGFEHEYLDIQETSLPENLESTDEEASETTQPKKKKKSSIKKWVYLVLLILLFSAIVKNFFFNLYVVSNNYMGSTLMKTDYVLVNKLAYGPRVPKTIFHIPFTYQKIWGTNVPSYVNWFSTPDKHYGRLWGYTQPKRQDILVFGFPNDTIHPIDLKDNAIGRCVGLPGDTLEIINGLVKFNNKKLNEVSTVEKGYEVTPGRIKYLTESKARKNNVTDKLIFDKKKEGDIKVFPHHKDFTWNEDNFGPLLVPKKDVRIPLSNHNVALYADIIIKHDFVDKVQEVNGQVALVNVIRKNNRLYLQKQILGKDKQVIESILQNYTFKQNYYFVLADRRKGTIDSRHFGFVPENHIVGRADVVLLSYQGEKSWYNPLGWNRWFLQIK